MKKIIFSFIFLIPVCSVSAQESGVFLKLPISPRGAAMGDAFTALSDEPLGIYYNPAGIAFVKHPEVSLAYQIYLENINGDSAGLVLPFGNFAIGIAPTMFKMKEETLYDSFGNDTGQSFGYQTVIAPVALAGRIGGLAVGVAAKYYSEKIGDQSSQTKAYDAGAIYSFGKLRFGYSSQNYGGKIFEYDVAKIQRLGVAYMGAGGGITVDAVKEGTAENYLNAGGEFSVFDSIKLRAGWRLRAGLGGPTFGVGLNLGNISIDYAFVGYGDLGNTHIMGLSCKFGSDEKKYVEPKPYVEEKIAPIAATTNAPQLFNYGSVGLSTGIGNANTSFGYRVKYMDADNYAPAGGYPKVHIKKNGIEMTGSPFSMEYLFGYNTTGAIYGHSQILPAGNDYSYYFEAKDASGADASGAATIPAEGPVVYPAVPQTPNAAPNSAPLLLWTGEENYASVGLSTGVGNTNMSFGYRVKYTDADNDAPAIGYPKVHIKKNGVELKDSPFEMEYISGDNRTGAIYSHSQMLSAGNDYSYYFEAKDTPGAAASGVPTVMAEGPMVSQFEVEKLPGGINIAVAEFIGKNVSPADASIVADFLRTELVNTGMFNVMDRDNMDSVLAEQKFQNSGCTDQQCAVEMGKLLNVRKMLVGSLSKLLDTYYITVNVVDVETGKILASYDSDAATSKELKDACRKIAEKLSRN